MPATVPTAHPAVLRWVDEIAALTTPDRVVWCDGSPAEWDRLTTELVDKGTFVRLDAKPNSFWCVSDPEDVARVEDRTFICSEDPADAGPTNNRVDPVDIRTVLTEHYRGAMTGRTMSVIAFCMGPLDAAEPKFGVQITDSAYVAVSMQIMTRSGTLVWEKLGGDTEFVRCLHSVGAPLAAGQADVPWPCDPTPAEHMLILKLTSPQGKTHYVAAAFPVFVRQDRSGHVGTGAARLAGRDHR